LLLVIAFGALTTTHFNLTMGVTDLAAGGPGTWFHWGWKPLVAPVTFFGFVLIGIAVMLVFYRVVRSVIPSVNRVEAALVRLVRRNGFDTADHIAAAALIAAVALVVVGCWWFSTFIDALMVVPDISAVPASQLEWLSPGHRSDQVAYGRFWMWSSIACAVLWCAPLVIARRRRERVNALLVAGGGALTVLAVVLYTFPYITISGNTKLRAVTLNGFRCYRLVAADRLQDLTPPDAESVRLFCPLATPRTTTVDLRTTPLTFDPPENPFTPFSDPAHIH
jgi:hypothetical protein